MPKRTTTRNRNITLPTDSIETSPTPPMRRRYTPLANIKTGAKYHEKLVTKSR